MKKLVFSALAVFAFGFANAQESSSKGSGGQTSKGKWLIEANTGFGAGVGATQIGFSTDTNGSSYGFGAEGGYFVMDRLAVKAGLGFGGNSPKGGTSTSSLGYKIGAKYYVIDMIPVELSYNGISTKGASDNPSWVGLGAGYAIFLGDNVSIEPGVRYNMTLDDKIAESFFQFNVGFALHF